jgi:voltage-gated potassium channel
MPNFQTLIARATDSFTEVIAYYLTILTASGLLFSYLEGKPLFESFWWAIVTGLTIGYGDLYPVTFGGKIVAIALMHLVPLVIVPLIVARLLITVIENRNEFTHEEQEEMRSDIKEIKRALGLE